MYVYMYISYVYIYIYIYTYRTLVPAKPPPGDAGRVYAALCGTGPVCCYSIL